MLKVVRRLYARISQPGTGGLVQSGDWRVVYPGGEKTRWLSYGDAANLRAIYGGKLLWRGDCKAEASPHG